MSNHGTLRVEGSTIAGNSAAVSYSSGSSAINAGSGGGLDNEGILTLHDTILAGNTAAVIGQDLFVGGGTATSLGHNLIGNVGGAFGANASDLMNANPKLGPLGSYGGPTPTLPLLPGSPAIDAGSVAPVVESDVPGLSGWWKADGDAIDAAGGHNGTLVNGATFAPGHSGQAFSLDGSKHSYVAIPSSADIVGTGAFTVSAWIRTTSDGVILQQRDPNHFNGEYILSVVGGRVYFATYGNFQYGVNFQSNTSVNDGAWHLITAVRLSNGSGQIFIDGYLDNTVTGADVPLASGFNVYIGGDVRDNINYLHRVDRRRRHLRPGPRPARDPRPGQWRPDPDDRRARAGGVSGTAIDIGAYERQSFVVTTTADAGPGSLRQAIADDTDGSPIVFSPSLAGSTIQLAST